VGGLPFPVTRMLLPEGSVIALHTDGLLTGADPDPDAAMLRLVETTTSKLGFAAAGESSADLAAACDAVIDAMDGGAGRDDAALLLARTGMLPPSAHVRWEFPAEAEIVAETRRAVRRTLAGWGLDELVFTTELVVTELVTNAFRHASGPIGLRLIRDRALVCEVSDPSDTQPRMRRALTTDEGGRGLLLVAQLTDRWGCRHGPHGKTIWTEQQLPLPVHE
jgi:anti-sigma regulatory factor (Ser/Thr protein kinase)